jgi:hypothetical protein
MNMVRQRWRYIHVCIPAILFLTYSSLRDVSRPIGMAYRGLRVGSVRCSLLKRIASCALAAAAATRALLRWRNAQASRESVVRYAQRQPLHANALRLCKHRGEGVLYRARREQLGEVAW